MFLISGFQWFLSVSLFTGVYDYFILYNMPAAELCRTSKTDLSPEGVCAELRLVHESVGMKSKAEVEGSPGGTKEETSLEEVHWTMRPPFTRGLPGKSFRPHQLAPTKRITGLH